MLTAGSFEKIDKWMITIIWLAGSPWNRLPGGREAGFFGPQPQAAASNSKSRWLQAPATKNTARYLFENSGLFRFLD
jgi:hypothetical protein